VDGSRLAREPAARPERLAGQLHRSWRQLLLEAGAAVALLTSSPGSVDAQPTTRPPVHRTETVRQPERLESLRHGILVGFTTGDPWGWKLVVVPVGLDTSTASLPRTYDLGPRQDWQLTDTDNFIREDDGEGRIYFQLASSDTRPIQYVLSPFGSETNHWWLRPCTNDPVYRSEYQPPHPTPEPLPSLPSGLNRLGRRVVTALDDGRVIVATPISGPGNEQRLLLTRLNPGNPSEPPVVITTIALGGIHLAPGTPLAFALRDPRQFQSGRQVLPSGNRSSERSKHRHRTQQP
jgi:hypothetical protein